MGDTFDVFGVSRLPEEVSAYTDARDDGVKTLFLLPNLQCDCEAVCLDRRRDRCISPSAAMAAAVFLVRVRGLPSEECEVLCGERIYTVTFAGKDGKCEILLKKCKELYEIPPKIYQNVEIKRWLCRDAYGEALVTPTKDAMGVGADSLRLACLPEIGELRMPVALSVEGSEVCVRYLPCGSPFGQALRSAVIAATYAMRYGGVGGEMRLTISDCRRESTATFYARSHLGGLAISADSPPPAVLLAPNENFGAL